VLKKLKRQTKPWLSLLPWLLLVLLIIALSRFKVFAIKKIDCDLEGYPCPLAYEPALVGLSGKNLLTVKTIGVVSYLQAIDPTLVDIKINKALPNSVSVVLKRSPAVAYVVTNDSWFHLDVQGNLVALPEKPSLVLPLVKLQANLSVEPLKLSELVKALSAAPISFAEVSWESENLALIKTTLGPQALINPSQPISPAIATLQYILTNLKIGEKLPTIIDLRFDKPILNY